MDFQQVWTLYRHEVRSALRERSIVVVSIVLPLVLYPTLLWAIFAGTSFVEGQVDRLTLSVAVAGVPDAHPSLRDSLEANGRLALSEWTSDAEDAQREIARGRLDALVRFEPAGEVASELANNFRAVIAYNEARDRSRGARDQVEAVIGAYRQEWIDEERRALGVPDAAWAGFRVVRDDLSTPDQDTRYILALLVPFLTLIMVALAAFYPAIDATAGERERSTWETLMTVAAPRGNIAAAKYLYVATFGAMGGLLNLAALTLSLQWILRPIMEGAADELGRGAIPLGALAVIAAGTALLGLFVAACMLVLAVFARNFKEGQSMITPFYMVIILPLIFLQSPDIELTAGLALVPMVNVVLLIRMAILGSIPLVPGALTLLSMTVFVALSIGFAQWIMRREEVLLGAAEGGLGQFLRRQFRNRRGVET